MVIKTIDLCEANKNEIKNNGRNYGFNCFVKRMR